MGPFDSVLTESLNRYFNVLEKTGYIKDLDVFRLTLLSFILEFLEEYPYYITEKDYCIILNIVNCLSNTSCLVPYLEFIRLSAPSATYLLNIPFRETEILTIGGENLRTSNLASDFRMAELTEDLTLTFNPNL